MIPATMCKSSGQPLAPAGQERKFQSIFCFYLVLRTEGSSQQTCTNKAIQIIGPCRWPTEARWKRFLRSEFKFRDCLPRIMWKKLYSNLTDIYKTDLSIYNARQQWRTIQNNKNEYYFPSKLTSYQLTAGQIPKRYLLYRNGQSKNQFLKMLLCLSSLNYALPRIKWSKNTSIGATFPYHHASHMYR